ncbi:MAG: T9SS type A sorting domain-containing protein, partial [Cryomorphaceae bacterium]
LLLLSLNSFCQDLWPHDNSEWWSQITYYLFTPAWEHSYVDGDTLIEDKLCTKHTTDRIYAFPNTPDDIQVQSSKTEYIYFNGDTLFWRYEDFFLPLICFNAEVGDSWYPLPQSDIDPSCQVEPIMVLEADSVEYNDEWFRRVKVGTTLEETAPFFWSGYFDERTFGRSFFYPEFNYCEGIIEWIQMSFMCYNDSVLSVPDTDEPCGFSLSVDDEIAADVKVYPNPIVPGETITAEGAKAIALISASGKRLHIESGINQFEIPNGTPPGIYIIELSLINGDVTYSKLLVN